MTNETQPVLSGDYACHFCLGQGRIARFAHIANGVCFTCKGSGRIAGRPMTARGEDSGAVRFGVQTVQVGEIVWQLVPINADSFNAQPGQEVATAMLQAFKAGSARATGTTLLRCRIKPAAAKAAWKRAMAGESPADISNADLGLPEAAHCSWNRNRRGIQEL